MVAFIVISHQKHAFQRHEYRARTMPTEGMHVAELPVWDSGKNPEEGRRSLKLYGTIFQGQMRMKYPAVADYFAYEAREIPGIMGVESGKTVVPLSVRLIA